LEVSGYGEEELSGLAKVLADKAGMHVMISADAERFMQDAAPGIAAQNHRTAERLGANPTNHLSEAYEGIEGDSNAEAAFLRVPGDSRLRAAFGGYRVTPKNRKYLTLPYIAEAYGRRAREFSNLVFGVEDVDVPGYSGPMRVLKEKGTDKVLFTLAKKADIKEQPGLIPFEELANEALRSAGEYIDLAIEEYLNS
jgi:hypothetical protein